jgi:hypothetical protein
MTCQEDLCEMLDVIRGMKEVGEWSRPRLLESQEVRAVFFALSFAC